MRLKHIDKIGQKFGYLTIVDVSKGAFHCVCDCGREHNVTYYKLFNGEVKSCGVKGCEYAHSLRKGCANHVKHRKSNTRLYSIWNGMKSRCYRTDNRNFRNYGGRGISVCEEWRDNFEVFEEWALSNGYADHLTIDRINNDGNYEPSNCRWATRSEQDANKRVRALRAYKDLYVWEINGVKKSIIEWCAEYGLSRSMVTYRVNVKGMTPYEALTAPLSPQGRGRKSEVG